MIMSRHTVFIRALSVVSLICSSNRVVYGSTTTANKRDNKHNNNNNNNNCNNNMATSTTTSSASTPHVHIEGILWPLEKDLEHDVHDDDDDDDEHDQNKLPPTTKLRFNGAGVRSVNFFGWDFKVYVAGFYHATTKTTTTTTTTATRGLASPDDVYQALDDRALQFDFTFLRTFGQAQVTQAWQKQLEHSVELSARRYDDYEGHRDAFIDSFGPISAGGTISVALHPCGRTVLIDQGTRKNVITSRNFQRAFLSMWFGSEAVQSDLKQALLGAGHHHHQQQQHPDAAVMEQTVHMNGQ